MSASTTVVSTRTFRPRRTFFLANSLTRASWTMSQPYVVAPASYGTVTPLPAGYSISADATAISGRDANTQRITATVRYDGEVLMMLEDFKLNR